MDVVGLVSSVMLSVHHHLLSAQDMTVCVSLLQLVELRARNWRLDASADLFYNSRRRMLAEQQVRLCRCAWWHVMRPSTNTKLQLLQCVVQLWRHQLWALGPRDFQLLNFSGHFKAA